MKMNTIGSIKIKQTAIVSFYDNMEVQKFL